MSSEEKNIVTRRSFLKGASATLAVGGVGLTAGGIGMAIPRRSVLAEAEWPLPYVQLDPEVVRLKGHLGYYEGECCYGAFWAIVDTLREEVGGPYEHIPSEIMSFGGGGVAGWGTTCGALVGACSALSLAATDKETVKLMSSELLGWYTRTALPTDKANQYAIDGAYLVDELKAEGELIANISNSPLCHVSVGKWCEASGFPSGSKERSERCGRLTGDTAARTVEMLNQLHADGELVTSFAYSPEVETCRTCHFKGKEFESGQFTRGKMECTSCHDSIDEVHNGDD